MTVCMCCVCVFGRLLQSEWTIDILMQVCSNVRHSSYKMLDVICVIVGVPSFVDLLD